MEDLALPIVVVTFLGLSAWEALRPARRYPQRRFWKLRGAFAAVFYVALASALPFVWDAWLAEHRLLDATALPLPLGALAAFLAVELLTYAWHRTMHAVPFLWRWFHQMHHSAERIDVWSALLFSPLDIVGFTFASSLGMVLGVGVSPDAAALAGIVAFALGLFQHANVRTPRWLGYLVQRPENHALHHARGVHRFNYGNLALFDLLFGTFRNPERVDEPAGFYDGASDRVGAMLLGRDVSTAPGEPEERLAAAAE